MACLLPQVKNSGQKAGISRISIVRQVQLTESVRKYTLTFCMPYTYGVAKNHQRGAQLATVFMENQKPTNWIEGKREINE